MNNVRNCQIVEEFIKIQMVHRISGKKSERLAMTLKKHMINFTIVSEEFFSFWFNSHEFLTFFHRIGI